MKHRWVQGPFRVYDLAHAAQIVRQSVETPGNVPGSQIDVTFLRHLK